MPYNQKVPVHQLKHHIQLECMHNWIVVRKSYAKVTVKGLLTKEEIKNYLQSKSSTSKLR